MKRTKKCKYCKSEFMPFNSLQKSCFNSECIRQFNAEQADKKWKKRKKVMKDKIKPLSKYKAEMQTIINSIIHHLDFEYSCISCGGNATEAGHYYSRGSHSRLAYNFHNIWMQCHTCNNHKGANIVGYDDGLIKTFGKEYWEFIKFDLRRVNKDVTLSKELIQEKKPIARQILKEVSQIQRKLSNAERIQLRDYYNEQLGIYKQ